MAQTSRLPPLNALRAFEAAARLESFAKAQLVDGSVVVINGYFPRLSLKELAATVLSVLGRGATDELRSHTLQVRESPYSRNITPCHAETQPTRRSKASATGACRSIAT